MQTLWIALYFWLYAFRIAIQQWSNLINHQIYHPFIVSKAYHCAMQCAFANLLERVPPFEYILFLQFFSQSELLSIGFEHIFDWEISSKQTFWEKSLEYKKAHKVFLVAVPKGNRGKSYILTFTDLRSP